jgi:hypothetical protein
MPLMRLLPAILALLVAGAHFLRARQWPLVVAIVVLLALVPLRRRFVAWVLQGALVLAAIEWLRTAADLVGMRQALGQPWARMAAILGTVALLTALSALVFRSGRVRAFYEPPGPAGSADRAANGPGRAA